MNPLDKSCNGKRLRMEVGTRVVRGPDWKWKDQDTGEGHLGTVVEIGRPGNNNTPEKTVVIHWDYGFRTNYRVGYQSAFDLRIYDTAPSGVKHPDHVCNTCKTQGIMGMRWKCARCHDFDLCHVCYMRDEHDVTHPFLRFMTPTSQGVKVDKRAGAVKVQARGIFKNAMVVRGHDWDWGNQDGGEGQSGTVLELRGWDGESARSVANIAWDSGVTNVYRLGHKGKVDLKCVAEANGAYYYREHLPVLGQEEDRVRQTPNVTNDFKVGDRVRVDLEVDILKTMQEGHGGWNSRMAECIGQVGYVHRITDKGDVRVQFENCANRWTFYTGALTKVQFFSVGDHVKVSEELPKVKALQKGHGEWTESMRTILGKTGRVQKVYRDGDLRILVGEHVWTVNPVNCTLLKDGQNQAEQQQENSNTQELAAHKREPDPSESLADYMGQLTTAVTGDCGDTVASQVSECERLVKAAAQGLVDVVTQILTDRPQLVDERSLGKTALQVASHQGHLEIVRLLLEHKANVQLKDSDGDSALHYSAFGNQARIAELLLKCEAGINLVNNTGCTALHVAVNKLHTTCVEALLACTLCQHSVQDAYGDTPLHDAVGKDKRVHGIVDLLLVQPGIDLTVCNKRGFNVLHYAALKGNQYVTQKILQMSRHLVDVRKEDGYTALHLAALNGHADVLSVLMTVGGADLEVRTKRQQTPLYLAVSQGHAQVIEMLVSAGASLVMCDEEGDSVLHQALSDAVLLKKTPRAVLQQSPVIAQIYSQLMSSGHTDLPGLAIACFLLQRGTDFSAKNKLGQLATDTLNRPDITDLLKRYSKSRLANEQACIPPPPSATSPTRALCARSSSANQNSARRESPKPRDRSAGNRRSRPETRTEETIPTKPSAAPLLPIAPSVAQECIVCEDLFACVTFQPCGHMVACTDCSLRMKKCLRCSSKIEAKYGPDKKPVVSVLRHEKPELRVQELENRLQNMEDTINCAICMERRRTMAFLCGHSACAHCAAALTNCHICRKPISRRIPLYE